MKKLVYISGPFSRGDVAENIQRVIKAAEYLVYEGFVPFVPHLTHLWDLIHKHPHSYWLDMDIEIVKRCDVLLRFKGESKGADVEERVASENDIPVYYDIKELISKEK